MNDADFRAEARRLAPLVDTNRWAYAELALAWRNAGWAGWDIYPAALIRRSRRTMWDWCSVAAFRQLWEVGSPIYNLPWGFHAKAARKLDALPLDVIGDLLAEFAAEEGATAEAFGAELDRLCKPAPEMSYAEKLRATAGRCTAWADDIISSLDAHPVECHPTLRQAADLLAEVAAMELEMAQ